MRWSSSSNRDSPSVPAVTPRLPTVCVGSRVRSSKERLSSDYGCGSGVLAIAALRLGVTRAIAVDHDLQVLEATRVNAEHNAVADRLFSYLPEKMPETLVDLLLANTLADPRCLNSRLCWRHWCTSGDGLSCGLSWQAFFVSRACKSRQPTHLRFRLDPPRTLDEWVLVSGRRIPYRDCLRGDEALQTWAIPIRNFMDS